MKMMWRPLNMVTTENNTTEAFKKVLHNLEVVDVGDTMATKLKTA
jgi:hypothetical protein